MEYFLINILPYIFLGCVIGVVCSALKVKFWLTLVILGASGFTVKALIDAGMA